MKLDEMLGKSVVVSSGVDWLTTTHEAGAPRAGALRDYCELLLLQERQKGEEVKAMAPQGYYGVGTKHVFFGERKDGYMARFSSAMANRATKELIDRDLAGRITRIDFQATVRTPAPAPRLAAHLRAHIRRLEAQRKTRRGLSANLFENDCSGYSVAFGSRRSACLYRGYDKTAEQRRQIAADLFRHEVELKRDMAGEAWGMLKQAASTEAFALSAVAARMFQMGFSAPWSGEIETVEIKTEWNPSSTEKRKLWLSNHVGNTLATLAKDGELAWLAAWFEEFTGFEAPTNAPAPKRRRKWQDMGAGPQAGPDEK